MVRKVVDPARLEGEALQQWYRRSPEEIRLERARAEEQAYDEFVNEMERLSREEDVKTGSDAIGSWQEAKGPKTTPRPPRQRIAPSDAGHERGPADGAGFFGTYQPVPSGHLGPAYVTPLPSPLNYVEPRPGDYFSLGNGRLVRGADEVERIYAEQQRRMRGQDETAPEEGVISEDRFVDGQIPLTTQLRKKGREEDATCHPFGGWELDPQYPGYSRWTQRYEAQVTRAPGLDYVVRVPNERPVKFDGCAVWTPEHELLEAKGPGYEGLIRRAGKSTFFPIMSASDEKQAGQQSAAARGRPVEWHIAEPGAVSYFEDRLAGRPKMRSVLDPPR